MSNSLADGQQFNPEMTMLINGAYQSAAEALDLRNAHSDRRAMLARVIIDLAREGVGSQTLLRDRAVAEVKRLDWLRHQAHEIWESKGRPDGKHDEHWAQAEREWSERGENSV